MQFQHVCAFIIPPWECRTVSAHVHATPMSADPATAPDAIRNDRFLRLLGLPSGVDHVNNWFDHLPMLGVAISIVFLRADLFLNVMKK